KRIPQRSQSARVPPAFDFRMAVGKRKSASAIMITGGDVPIPLGRGRSIRVTRHIYVEIAQIDQVLPLVPKHQGAGGTWDHQIRQLQVQPPGRARDAWVTRLEL